MKSREGNFSRNAAAGGDAASGRGVVARAKAMFGEAPSSRAGDHEMVAVLIAWKFSGVMALLVGRGDPFVSLVCLGGKEWVVQPTKLCAGLAGGRHRPVSSIWRFATPILAVNGGLGMKATRLALLRTFLQCRRAFGSGWFGTARLRLMHMSDDRVGSVAKTANLRQSRKAPKCPRFPDGDEPPSALDAVSVDRLDFLDLRPFQLHGSGEAGPGVSFAVSDSSRGDDRRG